MFMGPGMIEFFEVMRENLKMQGMDEAAFEGMFSGIKGAVLLDTLGEGDRCIEALKKAGVKLRVLETRKVGTENVFRVVKDAIERT